MSDEAPIFSTPLRRMTQAELDAFLEKAADILRGNVDHSEFRGYVFALLFFKRISDIFEESVRNLAKKVGDELANDPALQKKSLPFFVPLDCMLPWPGANSCAKNLFVAPAIDPAKALNKDGRRATGISASLLSQGAPSISQLSRAPCRPGSCWR